MTFLYTHGVRYHKNVWRDILWCHAILLFSSIFSMNMKFVKTLLLFLALSGSVFADSVSYNEASKIASSFLNKEIAACSDARSISGRNNNAPYYIFNATDGKGFVIVSGDDNFPSVIGYSKTNSFVYDEGNVGLTSFLKAFEETVSESSYNSCSQARYIEKGVPQMEPLIKSSWGQGEPYNLLCPVTSGQRCVVGCVATALSQVLNYWQWPAQGRGELSYVCTLPDVGKITLDFSQSVYDWDAMKLTTEENKADEAARAAVSRLCYDCGVATRMEYGSDGSGTRINYIVEGIHKYFGYKASTLNIKYRACANSQEEWNEMLIKELKAGRPVIYGGADMELYAGHCFIVDGYDSNEYFHVNWGWNGEADGYYAVHVLNVGSFTFADQQSAIIGLEPDKKGTDTIPCQIVPYLYGGPTCNCSAKGTKLGYQDFITIPKIYNYSPFVLEWTIGIGLFDKDGNLIENVKKLNFGEESDELQIPGFVIRRSYSTVVSIPTTCADGEYCLRLMFKQKGYDNWVLPDVEGGSDLNYIKVTVSDGRAYYSQDATAISEVSSSSASSVSYYDATGRIVSGNTKGLVIEKKTLSDGSVSTRKRWVK